MGYPFSDITLYLPTESQVGTREYWEQVSMENYVSDLYVQKMYKYKPPNTVRITIQSAYHKDWNGRSWKFGSIHSVAPYFSYEDFKTLNKPEKYRCLLDLIQSATLQLSEEYQWDKAVFERAYREVLECDFQFNISYPAKLSKNRKQAGYLSLIKTETTSALWVNITSEGNTITRKLFEKKNQYWYDNMYKMVQQSKWFDANRFGIRYAEKVECWYSLAEDKVVLCDEGQVVDQIEWWRYSMSDMTLDQLKEMQSGSLPQ